MTKSSTIRDQDEITVVSSRWWERVSQFTALIPYSLLLVVCVFGWRVSSAFANSTRATLGPALVPRTCLGIIAVISLFGLGNTALELMRGRAPVEGNASKLPGGGTVYVGSIAIAAAYVYALPKIGFTLATGATLTIAAVSSRAAMWKANRGRAFRGVFVAAVTALLLAAAAEYVLSSLLHIVLPMSKVDLLLGQL